MMDVTPEKLKEEMDKGTAMTIVDLQSNKDYQHSHVPGAVNLSFDTFKDEYGDLLKEKDQVIVVYGEYDELGKGENIGPYLEEQGYTRVGRLVGGLMGWKNAGYPTEGGRDS